MMRRSVLKLARPVGWRGPSANARTRRPNFALAAPSLRTMSTSTSGGGGGMWAGYLRLLEQKPLTTKVVTSGVIAAIGDVLCQSWFEGHVDGKRLAIFSFLGAALVGPTLHVWYGVLNRLLPAAGTAGAFQRMAVDQGIFAPTFVPTFISSLMFLEGKPLAEIPSGVKEAWWPAVSGNWVIWIPAQLINFRLVPPHLQVLFANVVGMVWNVYLSWVSHGGGASDSVHASSAGSHGVTLEQKAAIEKLQADPKVQQLIAERR